MIVLDGSWRSRVETADVTSALSLFQESMLLSIGWHHAIDGAVVRNVPSIYPATTLWFGNHDCRRRAGVAVLLHGGGGCCEDCGGVHHAETYAASSDSVTKQQ